MRLNRVLTAGIGLAFGLALCWLLIAQVGALKTQTAQFRLHWPALLGVMATSWLLLEAGAAKWACLDRLLDRSAPQPHAYYRRHLAWQNWLAQFLPPTITLVASRALVTHHAADRNWRRGLENGVIDQGSELLIILAFIPASLWQLTSGISFPLWLAAGLITTCAASIGGMIAWPHYIMRDVMLWSGVRVALLTMRLMLGAVALGLPLDLWQIAYATPPATLTALLPLTPGNLGVAEWGWTYVLTLWHADPAITALYALSFRGVIFVAQTLLLPLMLRRR
jgi:hypothetical protein